MAYPVTGQTPYGADLKAYIDDGDAASSGASVPKALVDAKGDLLVGTATDTVGRLAVGATGRMLFADSSQTTGLRWGEAGELPRDQSITPADLNSVVAPGVYYVSGSGLNIPRSGQPGHLEVYATQAGTLIWQRFSERASSLVFNRRSENSGSSWTAWDQNLTNSARAGNTITGTGMPEGVVTAPVGTEYTDTAATNGAVKWIKASGSGNTGWRVVYGDTGTRNVSSLLPAGVTAAVARLSRVGPLVEMEFENLVIETTAASVVLLTLPAGLTPSSSTAGRQLLHTGTPAIPSVYRTTVASGVELRVTNPPAGVPLFGALHWRAGTVWPSSLPGTVA